MWAYNETFYQIYPIGFCGAPVHNDGVTEHRILKIGEWAEYLGDLGIGSIILNPIFESDNHGYDTRDFRKIDCRLGTNEDFKEVCEKLHDNNVKIMLDGVFNHVGRGFWAFKDVQEKKWDSPYKDWFHISFDGNSAYNDGFWYEGWEGHFELVKLNLQNPAVVDYLLDCVKMWIEEFGIDGLRLDVAYCLDHNFMRRLRSFCEELKPGFALIGEVLFGDYNLIVNDEMLHSCTNYECYKGIFSSFNCMNLFEIAHSLNRQFGPEQWCIYRGKHLMTFVDNHDTQLGQSLNSWIQDWFKPLAYALILLRKDGIPCIFYGDYYGIEHDNIPPKKKLLENMIKARKHFSYGKQRDYFKNENIIGWVREGDSDHTDSGLAVVMSDNAGGCIEMNMGERLANTVFYDCTGNLDETVYVDANGNGIFYCDGGSVSVWIKKDNIYDKSEEE